MSIGFKQLQHFILNVMITHVVTKYTKLVKAAIMVTLQDALTVPPIRYIIVEVIQLVFHVLVTLIHMFIIERHFNAI